MSYSYSDRNPDEPRGIDGCLSFIVALIILCLLLKYCDRNSAVTMRQNNNTEKKLHKWENDVCVRCGLKRRPRPLSRNLMVGSPGHYFYDYMVAGDWTNKRPDCKLNTSE